LISCPPLLGEQYIRKRWACNPGAALYPKKELFPTRRKEGRKEGRKEKREVGKKSLRKRIISQ
jgi:hypothetical protein